MARTETNSQGEKRHEREEASFQKAFKSHSKSKALHKAGEEKKEMPKFAGKSSWSHKDKDFHKLNAFFQRGGK